MDRPRLAPKLFVPVVAMGIALVTLLGVAARLQGEASHANGTGRRRASVTLEANEVRALRRAIQRAE